MGRKVIDLTGKRFGRWVVLERSDKTSKCKAVVWKVQCSCGTVSDVRSDYLRNGKSTNCGCCPSGHGMSRTTEYSSWLHLKKESYSKEWDDFVQFFCDVGERPSPEHVIARKDGTKPHGKENTYWRHKDDERHLRNEDLGDGFCIDFRAHSRSTTSDGTREEAQERVHCC